MKANVRRVAALSLAAALSLGLAACGGGGNTPSSTATPDATGSANTEAGYASQIVVGVTAEPKYIEPNAPGMGPAEVQVSQQIFEGLVRTGDDGTIEPQLATDWTISDDGLTYTFNLVQGSSSPTARTWSPATGSGPSTAPGTMRPPTTATLPSPLTLWRPPMSR